MIASQPISCMAHDQMVNFATDLIEKYRELAVTDIITVWLVWDTLHSLVIKWVSNLMLICLSLCFSPLFSFSQEPIATGVSITLLAGLIQLQEKSLFLVLLIYRGLTKVMHNRNRCSSQTWKIQFSSRRLAWLSLFSKETDNQDTPGLMACGFSSQNIIPVILRM